jgi:hypothetical protein
LLFIIFVIRSHLPARAISRLVTVPRSPGGGVCGVVGPLPPLQRRPPVPLRHRQRGCDMRVVRVLLFFFFLNADFNFILNG